VTFNHSGPGSPNSGDPAMTLGVLRLIAGCDELGYAWLQSSLNTGP